MFTFAPCGIHGVNLLDSLAALCSNQVQIKDIKKQDRRLGELLEGKVAVIVNTASACGFTPQYKGLEELYQSYKDRGFVVIGVSLVPCDNRQG